MVNGQSIHSEIMTKGLSQVRILHGHLFLSFIHGFPIDFSILRVSHMTFDLPWVPCVCSEHFDV